MLECHTFVKQQYKGREQKLNSLDFKRPDSNWNLQKEMDKSDTVDQSNTLQTWSYFILDPVQQVQLCDY